MTNNPAVENGGNQKLLYSRQEAAQMLGISVRQLDYQVQLKELSARRVGRVVLFSFKELQRFSQGDHPGRPQC